MAKTSPVKKTTSTSSGQASKIPGWVTCCLIVAGIFVVLVVIFWILVFGGLFYGLTRYNSELKKAGFSYDPQKKSIHLRDQKTGEEVTVGEQNSIPKALANVPIYPGSKVVLKVESSKNPSVTLSNFDKSNTIYSWYLRELPKKGWIITSQQSFIIEFKDKTDQGTVALIQLDKGTTITITLEKLQ